MTSLTFPRMADVVTGLRSLLIAGALAFAPTALAQQAFPSPDAAAEALVDGIARNDDAKVSTVLGADWKKYLPARGVDSEDTVNFLAAWAKSHRIVTAAEGRAWLEVGTHGWTLPIPLVKSASGWGFDTKAAPEEMRTRRIGRNELAVIKVALAYADAQEDYARLMKRRGGTASFAQKIVAAPGTMDGLYWPSPAGKPESPLGPLLAEAKPGTPYHGYRYRILTAQGKNAPGGARNYVRDGKMTEGFALVAWPAKWGDTGVMTFIVNRDGIVYEKDLGPRTDALAQAMASYDPDTTWRKASSH